MAITEDASTPAVKSVTQITTNTVTTASFTPPANSLLVGLMSISYLNPWTVTPTMSLASSTGLSFTQLVWDTDTVNKFNAGGLYYVSAGASPGAMTVTATRGASSGQYGALLALRVLTSAISPPITLSHTVNTSANSNGSATVTPNAVGSKIYVQAVQAGVETITPTVDTTTILQNNDATDGVSLEVGAGTTLTTSPLTATNYGWTFSNSHSNIIQVFEVEASTSGYTASQADSMGLTDGATPGLSSGTGTRQLWNIPPINIQQARMRASNW